MAVSICDSRITNNEKFETMDSKEIDIEGLKMEYAAIREEIILLMNEHNTHISNLFLISITIIGLGCQFENSVLFLMLYFVIIPFQTLINNKQYMLIRCGVYIALNIEPKIKGLKWERTVHRIDKEIKNSYKVKIFGFAIEDELCDFGAFIFSVIAWIFYTYYIFMGGCEISHIKYSSVLGEAVAIAGTVISLMLCNKGRNFEKIYMECVETIK